MRQNDHHRAVVNTGFGLIGWALSWGTFWMVIWFAIILIFAFPWLLLLLLIPAFVIVHDAFFRRKAGKIRDQRHREKYGRDPRPW